MKLSNKKTWLCAFTVLLLIVSCQKEPKPIEITAEDYHAAVDKVTEIMVHDIFSPPVASRIYAYPNVAAYEIMSQFNDSYVSLAGQINDLTAIPKVSDSLLNPQLAALIAHMDLSRTLIFSEDRMISYRDSLYNSWRKINREEFEISKEYGLEVAEHIKVWMNKDQYSETRTFPKFTVNSDEVARWQPTPPTYLSGIEPHWNKIRSFSLDSAEQFKPIRHPDFSMEEGSDFYKELKEVYDVTAGLDSLGDQSEKVQIAQFWDCNPYVSTTRGHLMFATKKITPGAHWIGICKIASRNSNSDFDKTVFAYTKTSMAIADAFISCWDEKYRSNLVRPETLINQYIDENWKPILQTPPFPEYTSGHSVVSGAASVVLTDIFGENFAFEDTTEVPYNLPVRSFTSFEAAADEAAISRLYGGIHYMAAIVNGVDQGRNLGRFFVQKIKMSGSKELAVNK